MKYLRTMEHEAQPAGKFAVLLTEIISSDKYRYLRYLLFILAVGMVGYNQNAYSYRSYRAELGSSFFLMTAVTTMVFLAGSFVIARILVPKFLIRKRYARYFILSVAIVAVAVIILRLQDWYAASHFGFPNVAGTTVWPGLTAAALTDFGIYFICFTGVAVSLLLKSWMVEERQVAGLRKQQLVTEVTALKEQLNPELLFNALNSASSLSAQNPELSAEIIMKLSSMLRFQLYDSEKKYVSLQSELDFIRDYFSLSRICGSNFSFTIRQEKRSGPVFIPPLLAASLAVSAINGVRDGGQVEFVLNVDAGRLKCCCCYDKTAGHKEKPDGLHTRLSLLFGEDHVLNCKNSGEKCELMLVIPVFGYAETK